MNERKVLGRGLSSLIPTPRSVTAEVIQSVTEEIIPMPYEVSVEEIRINPSQPRRHFSEASLEELTQSIRRSGILQPLIVRKADIGFELIAGERRLRAARKLGLPRVPVVVRTSNDQDQLEIALIENLQREDLTPVEEAMGYERLIREFALTQEEVADKVGKERSTVSNLVRLLKLPSSVQQMINTGVITMGHARALLPLEDSRRQETIAQQIEKKGLSVRQVETLVRSMLRPSHEPRRLADQAQENANLRHLSEELQRVLGTRVVVIARGKGGEIRIQYYSSEDLKRLSDRLLAHGGTGIFSDIFSR